MTERGYIRSFKEHHRTRSGRAMTRHADGSAAGAVACGESSAKVNGPGKLRNGYHRRIFKDVRSFTDRLVMHDYNFQVFYDVMMVQICIFMTYVLLRDSYKAGRLSFDITMMYSGLGSVRKVVLACAVEAVLVLLTFSVYPAFMMWRWMRRHANPLLTDVTFSLTYSSVVLLSAGVLVHLSFTLPLPVYLKIVVCIEQVRLSMKSYSFIRENAYKVLYPWHKDDTSGPAVWYDGQMEPTVGSFSQYLFFLISPTFLYRDRYPRNQELINWRNAIIYFVQFITTIWYMGVVLRDMLFPASLHKDDVIHCLLNNLLCSFLLLVLAHTCVLHAYTNFVSEITRFADRQYYEDWWASTSFSSYYRRWNMLVHDWIHSYIYLDLKAFFMDNKVLAMFFTTFLSAFVHEYVLAISLGFGSPMMIIEFAGLGGLFYIMKPFNARRLSNILVIASLSVGQATLVFYYVVEYAARQYCPKEDTWANFFLPRMFECYAEHNA